jgi:Gpi18-like mannosyltransferase
MIYAAASRSINMGTKVKVPSVLQRIPHSVRVAFLVVIAAKVLVFAIGYAAAYMHGSGAPLTILAGQFNKWDAPHYVYIAQNWYVNTGDAANFIVFFPLYPLLIRLFTFDFNYINLSALAVANACSIVGFIYLYKLTKLDFSDKVAQKAVLFLSVFPTAYFLSAPYTEGLFFALVIASLYYARLGNWSLAGVLGLLAALTRIGGLLMLPVLLMEYLPQQHWKPKKMASFNFACIFIVLIGFLIYLDINLQVTGNPFMFMEIQRVHWFNTLDPVAGFQTAISWATNASYPENITIGLAPLLFAVFGFATVAVGWARRFRPSYLLYMLLTWMLAVSTSFWISVPRYVMAMFPMFILLGTLTSRKTVNVIITIAFSVALCYFTFLFASGQWAF